MILTTLATVFVVIAVPTLVGMLVGRLFARDDDSIADAWIDAPFLGLAAILLPLQIAYNLGLPLHDTTVPLLAIYLIIAVVQLARGRFGPRRLFPIAPFAVGLGVYAVQGIGLFIAGVDRYLGRAWGDQINYVSIAEFLWRFPASAAGRADLPPFAQLASPYLRFRIGQCVLLAVFARLAGTTAKAIFEPLILLSVFLIVLAIFRIARAAGLSSRASLVTAAAAGLMPAIASMQLECFLSQALALPLVFYVIVLGERVVRTGRVTEFIKLAMLLSALVAIYLEFFPFALACMLVVGVAGWWAPANRWIWFASVIAVIASPFVLGMANGILLTLAAVGTSVLVKIYPWALTLEGVKRLWFGDLTYIPRLGVSRKLATIVVTLTGLGYVGLLLFLGRSVLSRASRLPRTVLAVMVCGLAAAPLVILARDREHPYQFYKLMISMTPFVVLGLALLAQMVSRWTHASRPIGLAMAAGASAIAVPAVLATILMGLDAIRWPPRLLADVRGSTELIVPESFHRVEQVLDAQRDRPIVTCLSDNSWSGGYYNAWVNYFARENRVWAMNPRVNDQNLDELSAGRFLDGYTAALLPRTLLVTTTAGTLWSEGAVTSTVWQSGVFLASEPTRQPFAFACHWTAQPMDGHPDRATMIATPQEPDLPIFSNDAREADLVLRPAESTAAQLLPEVVFLLNGDPAPHVIEADNVWRYHLPLRAGLNKLRLLHQVAGGSRETLPGVLRLTDVRLRLASGAK